MLEIGPGGKRLDGFETLDVVGGRNVDYVCDAAKRLPFDSDTFDLVYASHVLEHIPWYQTEDVLVEWVRILKPRGALEIWVPDGFRICEALVAAEKVGDTSYLEHDGRPRLNPDSDPCKWASYRVFTWGDGTGRSNHPNWHRALLTPRYLRKALAQAGLVDIREMDRSEVRGYDHGWINLGMTGRKP